jgi:cellulose synthase/poly-beta-1,6-N-acetylglucosamine synthase-like glycosyltransferase
MAPPVLCAGEENRGYALWCEEREKQVSILYHNYPLRKGPFFSVLVPVYDPKPQWLEECIDSVRSQKYARWELILCDDGSGWAHVPAILEKAGSADDRSWGFEANCLQKPEALIHLIRTTGLPRNWHFN